MIGIPYVESYNPLTDQWCRLKQIIEPRAEFGMAIMGHKIYLMGGYSWDGKERLRTVETYDLIKNCSELIPKIDKAYTGMGACTLTLFCRLDGKPTYQKHDPPCLIKTEPINTIKGEGDKSQKEEFVINEIDDISMYQSDKDDNSIHTI